VVLSPSWPSPPNRAKCTFGTRRSEKSWGEVSKTPIRTPEPVFFLPLRLPEPNRVDLDIHDNGIFDLRWSPDDTALATCSGDHTARITDIATGKTTDLLRGHTSTVKTVVWDPQNASLLSTGGRDGGIRVWDLRIAERTSHGMTSHAPVIVIDGAHEEDKQPNRGGRRKVAPSARTVTSLVYPDGQSDRLISSGSFDG